MLWQCAHVFLEVLSRGIFLVLPFRHLCENKIFLTNFNPYFFLVSDPLCLSSSSALHFFRLFFLDTYVGKYQTTSPSYRAEKNVGNGTNFRRKGTLQLLKSYCAKLNIFYTSPDISHITIFFKKIPQFLNIANIEY
jgi:hypothetical protein